MKTPNRWFSRGLILVLVLSLFFPVIPVVANNTYQGLPFSQNWSNTALITVNDDWSGVPGIMGHLGDYTTSSPVNVDPQTLLADYASTAVDVNANQANPNTFTTGGVAEFDTLANPVVALQGSGTADAPYILLHINTTGWSNITISYNVRDVDGSADNAVQQVALQYRLGSSGNFTNVPAGYIADATTGPSLATLVTPVNIILPSAVDNQAQVQVRIMTTNATGSDEWIGIDDILITGVGVDSAPSVSSTTPADGATGVAVNSDVTVNFSENVNVTGGWVGLTCTTSGAHAAVVSGGPASFTIDPTLDFANGETCTLTVAAAQVADQDANDPPDNMAASYTASFTTALNVCVLPYTPAYSIQGSGLAAAITGVVTTQGVVVGDYELPAGSGQIRGFFLQDLSGDGDPATSDGIFVYNGGANSVSLGDVVRVTGTAGDFQDQTQIGSVSSIIACGAGSVAPTNISLPFISADFPERYEGMLVRLPQTLYVTEIYLLGRFGQVTVSGGDRLPQPTGIALPGAPAAAVQAANDLNQIILDDGDNLQNADPIVFGRGGLPLSASNTLRGGDTVTGLVGVLNYTWGGNSASPNAYRIRPVNALGGGAPNFAATNPRPASAPAVGGTTRVVGMNLLNYFNTFDGLPDTVDNCALGVGGAATDCRGADTPAEFGRQWPKTVAAMLALDADVYGIVEMENDGYGPASAIQELVDRLNAASDPGTFAFVDVDLNTGQVNALGVDAIKVGLIYQPARVTPVGQTAVLNTVAFVNGGDGVARNRPSLLQAFRVGATGEVFLVNVNHLKSKGSACDGESVASDQGFCNTVRVNAVNQLVSWFAADPTGTGDSDILVVGDLNSYAMEDPIMAFSVAGYVNMVNHFGGPGASSYVFDGQWGYLDYAIGSPSLLAQVTGVAEFHINSDEPSVLDYNTDFKSAGQIVSLYAPDMYRISDHDPVLVGLSLVGSPPTVLFGANTIPANGAVLATGPTQVFVEYSKDVIADGGADAANTPANYMLVGEGAASGFQTLSCAGGLAGGDAHVAIQSAVYVNNGGSGPFIATLNINGGAPLPMGNYRLYVCGTTSVRDLAGTALNGGLDSIVAFRVGAASLPATGFAPGLTTALPEQPLASAYAALGDLWLEIPRLGVRTDIVGVPVTNNGWDVAWLGQNAGWLQGTAFPTWAGNSAITGHVYDANGQPGPFINLHQLWYGERIIVHAFGQEYVYEVRSVRRVTPDDTRWVTGHEEFPWLTLITCRGYDPAGNSYRYRVVIRAVQVEIR